MKITWFGHSCFRIETGGSVLLIDPFLKGSPTFQKSGIAFETAIRGVTHVALTHGHDDHVGDAAEICKANGAELFATYELALHVASKGAEKLQPMNTGGTVFHDGFSVTLVNALHSSAQITEDGVSHALGSAGGLMFHFDDAPSLLHMGDTDIFSDMALIQELHQPQIGIVPIGDRFTMGGAVAAIACRRFFKFEHILPAHYASFPMVDQTADVFLEALEGQRDRAKVSKAGTVLTF